MARSLTSFILTYFVTIQAFAVGSVYTKQSESTTNNETVVVEAPKKQLTKTGDKKFQIETGNKNLLENPSFEHSTVLTGWGASGWGCNEELSVVRDGKKSCKATITGSLGIGDAVAQLVNPTTDRTGPWEFSMWAKTASSNQKICAITAAEVEITCTPVSNDNAWHLYTINVNPPSSGTFGISYRTAAIGNSFTVDDAYVGPARNIGQGVPNNVFSAKISSSGVVSEENEDFINGNCVITSTSLATCTFNTGKFSVTPSCVSNAVAGSGAISSLVVSQSTSSVAVVTVTTSTGNNTAAATNLVCTKAGNDFIQPTVTPNNYDFVNEFSAKVSAAGVVSDENQDWINGSCTIASNVFTCPFVSNKFAVAPNCTFTSTTAVSASPIPGLVSVSTSQFQYQTANDTGALNSSPFHVKCSRAGSDYRQQMPIPILTGSVTSNASGALKFEAALLNNTSGSQAVTTSSSSWLTTNTCGASGSCTYNLVGFSAAPWCVCSTNVGAAIACNVTTITQTSMAVLTVAQSGSTVNENNVKVMCLGPR